MVAGMPRPRTHTRESLADAALDIFWRNGFKQTSMDDLVRTIGVSRHSLYSEFGNKRDLFASVFDVYQRDVVTPAFAQVEADDAGLAQIEGYFESQIQRVETMGLPSRGCLVANTLNEGDAHNAAVLTCIRAHNQRFHSGFAQALRNAQPAAANVGELAELLVTFTHGLWSLSRVVDDTKELRRNAAMMLDLVKTKLYT